MSFSVVTELGNEEVPQIGISESFRAKMDLIDLRFLEILKNRGDGVEDDLLVHSRMTKQDVQLISLRLADQIIKHVWKTVKDFPKLAMINRDVDLSVINSTAPDLILPPSMSGAGRSAQNQYLAEKLYHHVPMQDSVVLIGVVKQLLARGFSYREDLEVGYNEIFLKSLEIVTQSDESGHRITGVLVSQELIELSEEVGPEVLREVLTTAVVYLSDMKAGSDITQEYVSDVISNIIVLIQNRFALFLITQEQSPLDVIES